MCLALVCGVACCVCTLIGLPMAVLGCDATFYHSCVAYRPATTTVVASASFATTCAGSCIAYDANSQCMVYDQVPCFGEAIDFDVGCQFTSDPSWSTDSAALGAANAQFPLASSHLMMVSLLDPSVCERVDGKPRNLAIAGTVFVVLACLFAVAAVCACVFGACTNQRSPFR